MEKHFKTCPLGEKHDMYMLDSKTKIITSTQIQKQNEGIYLGKKEKEKSRWREIVTTYELCCHQFANKDEIYQL